MTTPATAQRLLGELAAELGLAPADVRAVADAMEAANDKPAPRRRGRAKPVVLRPVSEAEVSETEGKMAKTMHRSQR